MFHVCSSSAADLMYQPQDTPFASRPSPVYSPRGLESNAFPIPQTYLSYAAQSCICQPRGYDFRRTTEPDEILLKGFREDLSPFYPFVVVPDHVAAQDLQSTRPFTMSAIRMVASFRNLETMRGQLFELMNYIADHMLLRAERSLDLLTGIVILLGWYHYHCIRHNQFNNLICLAQSLVGDLGLKRNIKTCHATTVVYGQPAQGNERSNEERRLLLAVWYLTSS